MSSGRPPQASSGGDIASKTRYDRDEHDFKNGHGAHNYDDDDNIWEE